MLLPDFQRRFTAYALRGDGLEPLSAHVKDNGLSAGQRLNIYRNNTQLGLTEALRDGFPVLNKLIGDACFNRLARDFIRQHPPTAGCLSAFGQSLPVFIAAYPALATLPYLADVARLEWYWHEAYHEADEKAVSVQNLATIEPEHYPHLIIRLQPSVRLLASGFPVLPIWQSNQEDYEGDGHIDLNQEGSRMLIFRPALEVLMFPLAEADYRFISTLQQGLPLAEALTDAFNADNAFDLFAVLQRWFALGLFSGFFLKNLSHQEF